MTSGSLWNYYGDEVNGTANENNVANYRRNNNRKTKSRFFEYKTPAIASRLDTKVVVPLKCLINFWRFLDLVLINCEIDFDLSWSNYGVISV